MRWSTIFIIVGCKTTQSISDHNLSSVYADPKADDIKVRYRITNRDVSTVRLHWRIVSDDLTPVDPENPEVRSVLIQGQLYTTYSELNPADSFRLILKEIAPSANGIIQGFADIVLPSQRNFVLALVLRDLASLKVHKAFLDVLNPTQFTAQSLHIYDFGGNLVFDPWLSSADSFILQTNQSDRLYDRIYDSDFSMAAPPFAVPSSRPFDFNASQNVSLSPLGNGQFKLFVIREGIHFVCKDTTGIEGGALFYFGPHYPEPRTVNDLFLPLRYITSNAEYSEIGKGDNIKRNVDAYWLRIAGSPDRARQLISQFYGRVERANVLFPSYMPGWKTDRGMCYIVFGAPVAVHRSSGGETWYYGVSDKNYTLRLNFTKVSNPFTTNDLRLNRSGELKAPWHRAVEFWRQGRVVIYR